MSWGDYFGNHRSEYLPLYESSRTRHRMVARQPVDDAGDDGGDWRELRNEIWAWDRQVRELLSKREDSSAADGVAVHGRGDGHRRACGAWADRLA